MEENKEIFTYTYSARQQEEVRRILQKYTPLQEDKMELLRRLDKSAQQPGTIAGIALGVCGTLMLGLGMCCTMVWTGVFALGVAVGCTGIAVLALAYPMFLHLTKRRRAQLAPQIEALSRELLGQSPACGRETERSRQPLLLPLGKTVFPAGKCPKLPATILEVFCGCLL